MYHKFRIKQGQNIYNSVKANKDKFCVLFSVQQFLSRCGVSWNCIRDVRFKTKLTFVLCTSQIFRKFNVSITWGTDKCKSFCRSHIVSRIYCRLCLISQSNWKYFLQTGHPVSIPDHLSCTCSFVLRCGQFVINSAMPKFLYLKISQKCFLYYIYVSNIISYMAIAKNKKSYFYKNTVLQG